MVGRKKAVDVEKAPVEQIQPVQPQPQAEAPAAEVKPRRGRKKMEDNIAEPKPLVTKPKTVSVAQQAASIRADIRPRLTQLKDVGALLFLSYMIDELENYQAGEPNSVGESIAELMKRVDEAGEEEVEEEEQA